jgi:hypothetical protein
MLRGLAWGLADGDLVLLVGPREDGETPAPPRAVAHPHALRLTAARKLEAVY